MFIRFNSLAEAAEPIYKILRKQIGNECFILNNQALATILAESRDEIAELREKLPPYTFILNLTAGEWFPEERIAYQQEALENIAWEYYLKLSPTLPGIAEAEKTLSSILLKPWDRDTLYWRFRFKGASEDVFFLTPLRRAQEFLDITHRVVSQYSYPVSDLSIYLQPKQWGHAFHMEIGLPYDPESPKERSLIENMSYHLSEQLIINGAFFYRLYGKWTEMVYNRTGYLHGALKEIKKVLDPNMILNPGKLNF